ncbi:alpha/beta hydrolase [Patescibacteria group bacterium AH-259-L05]|nr:alpha/beta hydrolase [Patescibacteria group bacterium AH-259-L05]
MKETKVSIFNEYNEKLVGIETVPSIEKETYPTILLVHGFGVRKEEGSMFDELAEELSEAEFLVYRFDFSGRGESEGDYRKTSLSKQKSDLSKILDFVKSQSKVDTSKIGILAQSFGTSVTVSQTPQVKALILMGSIAHPNEVLGKPLKWVKLDREGISKKIKSNGEVILIGSQFWKDFDKYNLLELIKKIDCPILFIHGSKDDRVPLSEMEAYFDNANEPKEKIIIAGADHGLRPHRDKMYRIVVDWFKKYLV